MDTLADWVVTSPKGTKLVFQRDTGRCEGFLFVYRNDPMVIEFFGKIRDKNIERITQEIASEQHFSYPRHYCEAGALLHPIDSLE